ncbi:MAG: C25 family cysteine peptidase [Chloroflexi bacterium]|nr:C25 family cysteine peptidase [Chloroflexota bacterium]
MPQQYIATTSANLLTNANGLSLTAYTPPANLEPAGGADWVAITHADFLTQANSLAAHRGSAQNGGLKTHVVDFDDIVNVYNYGLRMPEAIHAYLQNALYTWPIPPGYAVLFGDGTLNPRNLDCSTVAASNGLKFCTRWDVNTQNFIPPDLLLQIAFKDLSPQITRPFCSAGMICCQTWRWAVFLSIPPAKPKMSSIKSSGTSKTS